MDKLIDIQSSQVLPYLDLLLQDKSTKKNIIWATDTYEELVAWAKKYDVLSFGEILHKNLGVMDSTAASLCRDNKMPILVFGLNDPKNIVLAVTGKKIGTLVNNEGK